jgi:hypothetical protein
MAQHAGFGAVATISESLIEDVAWAYIQTGPMFFPAPQSITIGQTVVRFSGIFEMLRPTIELRANPGNLVTIHFAFRCNLRAQADLVPPVNPLDLPRFRAYNLEVHGAVSLTPIISIQNQQFLLGINTASVNFSPLTAITLSGPALQPDVKDALESPTFAAIASAFVQSLPNIILTPPTLKTVIEKTVPGDFPDVGTSIFNWFTIRLEASNLVFKVRDGGITLAVDFRGRSSGDVNQLDSVMSIDNIWMATRTPADVEQDRPLFIVKDRPLHVGNLAVIFNMDVLSAEVASISRQTAHTVISKDAELLSLSLGYSTFTKPLFPGLRDGFKLGFEAGVRVTGNLVEVSGAVYLQPVVTVYEGPTNFLRPPSWLFRVAHSELTTAWWVDVIVFVISAIASVVLPFLFPIFALAAIVVSDAILPSLLGNARNSAAKGIEQSLFALPSATDKQPLPGLPGGVWTGDINHIAVIPEGLHSTLNISAWLPTTVPHIIAPEAWHAEYRGPMPFSVKLSEAMEKMASNLSVFWEVFRTDTNGLLRTRTRRYLGDDVLFTIDPKAVVRGVQIDPESNGILIGLRDPDFYFLEGVRVRCTVTATLGSQVGVIWSDEVTVKIADDLDRHRKFLIWGPHQVFFMNAGTNGEVWSHNRTSKIHRTATGARCMMLRQRAEATPRMRPKFRYFDTLPFEFDQLVHHRHFLCDYCFFGGPDKTTPFPQEDTF